jgi:hypothetical protein
MAGLSIHNETAYALPEAMTQEILAPTASGAWGHYAVLRRVHEPLLASIFWLALGCVLWGPHKVWVVPMHAEEGEEPSRSHAGEARGAGTDRNQLRPARPRARRCMTKGWRVVAKLPTRLW